MALGKGISNFAACGCKGQMFLIAAIIIAIGLIFMKNMLGIYITLSEERFIESDISGKKAENIKSEFRYITGLSAANLNITYFYNFSEYASEDADVLYVIAFVNGSTQRLDVTLGNFLKAGINYTINATSASSGFSGSLNHRSNITYNFAAANGTANVTLNYTAISSSFERFPITVSDRNFPKGFFDVTTASVRQKFTFNRTW